MMNECHIVEEKALIRTSRTTKSKEEEEKHEVYFEKKNKASSFVVEIVLVFVVLQSFVDIRLRRDLDRDRFVLFGRWTC